LAGLENLNVLIVDNNEQMRTIVGAVLIAAGVGNVEYASDGEAGRDRLRNRLSDIVYVDFEMPTMNRLEFIRSVRSIQSPIRTVPIIMLTSYADMEHIRAARDAGMTEYLRKPVTAAAILSRLNAVIMRPRDFVNTPTYVGPDRRRRQIVGYDGPVRRAKDTQGPSDGKV
jgi:CheY-like chemotaxis protein